MRIILDLDDPTAGTALVNGPRYATIDRSMHAVGALLDPCTMHGGRSAADHLRCLARCNGIDRRRMIEVLDEVGLVLLFDEPWDGLDPEGIRWIRDLTRSLAAYGRTVLVSSRHMSEMALIADQLLITARGKLITEISTLELTERSQRDVFVRSPRRGGLTKVLTSMGATVLAEPGGGLSVTGMEAWRIATAAAEHCIPIQELTPRIASLEDY
jgi:ABC-2 type transport system ATP-binding protein